MVLTVGIPWLKVACIRAPREEQTLQLRKRDCLKAVVRVLSSSVFQLGSATYVRRIVRLRLKFNMEAKDNMASCSCERFSNSFCEAFSHINAESTIQRRFMASLHAATTTSRPDQYALSPQR